MEACQNDNDLEGELRAFDVARGETLSPLRAVALQVADRSNPRELSQRGSILVWADMLFSRS